MLGGEGSQMDNLIDERGFRVLGSAQALIDDRISVPAIAPSLIE
jgi:hypothetical protein